MHTINQLYTRFVVFISLTSLALVCFVPSLVEPELFSSVDELADWPNITRQIKARLDNSIASIELKLTQLKEISESLGAILDATSSERLAAVNGNSSIGIPQSDWSFSEALMNPVVAFVTLNRFTRALDNVHSILSVDQEAGGPENPIANYESILEQLRYQLPTANDVVGSGKALLRLQMFYDINVDSLSEGLVQDENTILPTEGIKTKNLLKMNERDCFELGKIAFHESQFSLAIQWLHKSLQLLTQSNYLEITTDDEDRQSMTNDILEYMAFSAYRLGLLNYSIKLTRVWLEREPENERAKENLDYYLEELESGEENRGEPDNNDHREDTYVENDLSTSSSNSDSLSAHRDSYNHQIDIDSYSIPDDSVVRDLCRRPSKYARGTRCHTVQMILVRDYLLLGVKLEVLNEDPNIFRIYDVVTAKEAGHLKNSALPRLSRSTVKSGEHLSTSEFRIAKTAWLDNSGDPIVDLIEKRLSAITNLSMEGAESIQVVNYGLGGFYGPHLDSTRATSSDTTKEGEVEEENSAGVGELKHNDRLATILIYLNQIAAGGATAFPKLKLKVEPIERSAVVWHNINDKGNTDVRTLHTGCPVMLGSKWIATKWPRESPNGFAKQCRIQQTRQ